jgi:hypothetical protein
VIFACQENNDFALNCNEINFIEDVTKNLQLLASVLLELAFGKLPVGIGHDEAHTSCFSL